MQLAPFGRAPLRSRGTPLSLRVHSGRITAVYQVRSCRRSPKPRNLKLKVKTDKIRLSKN
jgi:hypothetical protein